MHFRGGASHEDREFIESIVLLSGYAIDLIYKCIPKIISNINRFWSVLVGRAMKSMLSDENRSAYHPC